MLLAGENPTLYPNPGLMPIGAEEPKSIVQLFGDVVPVLRTPAELRPHHWQHRTYFVAGFTGQVITAAGHIALKPRAISPGIPASVSW